MRAEPTIVYCVGATKAGTSWLYEYLRAHPQAHLRSVKELHYFDALERGRQDVLADKFRAEGQAISQQLGGATEPERRAALQTRLTDCMDLASLHARGKFDAGAYRRYLKKGREDQPLVGDLTPAYSTLSVESFRRMARTARSVRFVYLLRDPVARLWSHIRMIAERRKGDAESVQARADRIFRRATNGRFIGLWARSDYRGTIERLNAAVAPGRLLVMFYEQLFTGTAVDLLCDFLGVARCDADLSVPVHAGPRAEMSARQLAVARDVLADQYAYVQALTGELPQAWNNNMTRIPA